MSVKIDVKTYIKKVLLHWWIIAFSVILAIAGTAQDVIQSEWPNFSISTWVWLSIIFICFSIAQFLTWRDMKRERDVLRKYAVNQQTLSDLAFLRDKLISHQNIKVISETQLGQWIEQFNGMREAVNNILQERVSIAEHRAYDHIGLFTLYSIPHIPTLSDSEFHNYMNWRSRVARDHKWIEKFIHDYSRYRVRADLESISGQELTEASEAILNKVVD